MRKKIIAASIFLFASVLVIAGTNTLETVTGGVVKTSHVNQYETAFQEDIVPRNSSGVPTSLAGSLGTSALKWLKSFVASGGWSAGDIKMHHSYNGTVTCGEGWMLMDGRVINEANYNTEHGSGHWATYVISSPLDGKYLPDMDEMYPIGQDATTQDGSIAITTVGNASHQVNLSHAHTHHHTVAHHHRIFNEVGASSNFQSWDSSSVAQDITSTVDNSGTETGFWTGNAGGPDGCSLTGACAACTLDCSSVYDGRAAWDMYDDTSTPDTSDDSTSGGSAAQSIKPQSIDFQFCMRVID
jgi:hypothetical protein